MFVRKNRCLGPLWILPFIFWLHSAANRSSADEVPSQKAVLGDRIIARAQILELQDNSQLGLNADGQTTSIAYQDFCRIGVHTAPTRFPIALLTDGSYLSFTAIERHKNQFILQTSLWENISIPESLLRAVILAPTGSADAWYSLLDRVSTATGRNDQLLLSSRGWTEGILQWPESSGEILQPDRSQTLRINNEDAQFEVKEIEAIVFSPILTPLTNTKSPGRIGWKDGSLFACSQWRVTQPGDFVEMTLRCGVVLKSLDQPAAVASAIASLTNRPKSVSFLSDMEASSYKHVDWLTSKWPLGNDRDVYGRRLMVSQDTSRRGIVEKGLAMHATSQAAYRWDKSAGQFLSTVTLALPMERGSTSPGQAIVKILGLKNGKLETLYTSPVLTSQTAPLDISVSLEGIELIVLMVDAGPGGTLGDHILWLDSRIHK